MLFPVTKISPLNEMLEFPGAETTGRIGKFERPKEVGSLLEVGPNGVNLVDKVLNADNAVLAKALFDDGIVGERDALLVNFSIAALVNELTDSLEVGVAVGDERLDNLEHLQGGLGQPDENAVVDLEETEKLQGLSLLGIDFVDTVDLVSRQTLS